MSEKPHTVAIGAFMVGALLIAFSTVLFLLGSGLGEKETMVMVFDTSVNGLNVGAPMAMRGVQVGQVTGIELIMDSDTLDLITVVEADFMINRLRWKGAEEEEGDLTEALIARGLRAQLNTQSLLTGLLYVQLDFHPDSEIILADIDSPYMQLPTLPTSMERIARKLQDINITKLADGLDSVTTGINAFVSSEEFQAMPAAVKTALDSLTELSEQLQQQLAASGPKLNTVLDETATAMSGANTELPKISGMVESNLDALGEAISAFEEAMADIGGLVSHDSATTHRLNEALQEISRAGVALQSLAKTLEEQPESLIRGKSGDK
jgi:paraquat-inducible protein B